MKDTFLEELRSWDLHALAKESLKATEADVLRILRAGKATTLEEFAVLISPSASPFAGYLS